MRIRRLLAIDPTSRGFGYVALETPGLLVDWGTHAVAKRSHPVARARLRAIIRRLQPQCIVLEHYAAPQCRRSASVRSLLEAMEQWCNESDLAVRLIPAVRLRSWLGARGLATKAQTARWVAMCCPELAPRLPPIRKPWMSEDERMGIFDAAALALFAVETAGSRRQPLNA